METPPDTFDTLIVDEAHRLNEKCGLYRNLGDNQIRELIRSARCTVFFVDDDQRVTVKDIGHTRRAARPRAGVRRRGDRARTLVPVPLQRLRRLPGVAGRHAGHPPYREPTLDTAEFDFRVFDSPTELHELIERKNRAEQPLARRRRLLLEMAEQEGPDRPGTLRLPAFDYRRRWNLDKDGSLWIVTPGSVRAGRLHPHLPGAGTGLRGRDHRPGPRLP